MRTVKITLKKSLIKREKSQRATVYALGMGKINSSVQHTLTPQILGMIKKVSHLILVEEV